MVVKSSRSRSFAITQDDKQEMGDGGEPKGRSGLVDRFHGQKVHSNLLLDRLAVSMSCSPNNQPEAKTADCPVKSRDYKRLHYGHFISSNKMDIIDYLLDFL